MATSGGQSFIPEPVQKDAGVRFAQEKPDMTADQNEDYHLSVLPTGCLDKLTFCENGG